MVEKSVLALFFLITNPICFTLCAPKGRKPNYDQKQTGDYNIRVNLKDFQIIAVVDDSFADIGNYDYNYDYSELTIKPGSSSSTSTTQSTLSTTLTSQASTSSSPLVNSSQPSLISENSTINLDTSTSESISSTTKPKTTTSKPQLSTVTIQKVIVSSGDDQKSTTEENKISTEASATINPVESPDKIPVFIQTSLNKNDHKDDDNQDKNIESHATNVSILQTEEISENTESNKSPLGEIMYYRKCAQGYARDKRGRCRKVRRPTFPLGIARLATNLATKFRPTNLNESKFSSETN